MAGGTLMAQYNVQDPQGNMRVIEGPDGASDQEIISQAQQLFGQSGGMNAVSNSPLDRMRRAIAGNPNPAPIPNASDPVPYTGNVPRANPQAEFQGMPGAQDATVSDASNLYALYKSPEAIKGLYNLGRGAAGWLGKLSESYNAAKGAAELAGTETPLEAGNIMSVAKDTEQVANKAMSDALYAKIPKDLKISISPNTADSIINEVKGLPKSFQNNKIVSMASDIQDLTKADIPTIQAMQSALKDMAANGEGIERVYAARLSKSLQADLETFGKSSALPISQQPTLEAQDLRRMWGDKAMEQEGVSSEIVAPYVKPETFAQNIPASQFTNADIPANMSKANSYYRDMSELKNSPISRALDNAAMESKANVIFKAGRVSDVNAGKAILGDTGFNAAQGQFYQKLLKSKDIGATLSKYDPDFLRAALTDSQRTALNAVDLIHRYAAKAITTSKVIGSVGVGGSALVGLRKLIQ